MNKFFDLTKKQPRLESFPNGAVSGFRNYENSSTPELLNSYTLVPVGIRLEGAFVGHADVFSLIRIQAVELGTYVFEV